MSWLNKADASVQTVVDALVHFAMRALNVSKAAVLYGLLAANTVAMVGMSVTVSGFGRWFGLVLSFLLLLNMHRPAREFADGPRNDGMGTLWKLILGAIVVADVAKILFGQFGAYDLFQLVSNASLMTYIYASSTPKYPPAKRVAESERQEAWCKV